MRLAERQTVTSPYKRRVAHIRGNAVRRERKWKMHKICEAMTSRNGYAAYLKGYYDDKDSVRPYVLYLEHCTINTEHGWADKHRNKIARYGDYKTLLRDIADRI